VSVMINRTCNNFTNIPRDMSGSTLCFRCEHRALFLESGYRPRTKGGHILDKGCPICGSALTEIRGRYPNVGESRRKVCATCLQEKLEIIHEETSPDYCIADQNRSTQQLVHRQAEEKDERT